MLHLFQGNCQRHKETARCGQRDRLVHTRRYGQAGCGAAKEGVCQIFQEVQHNAEGVLQRRTVSISIYYLLFTLGVIIRYMSRRP